MKALQKQQMIHMRNPYYLKWDKVLLDAKHVTADREDDYASLR